MSFRRKTAIYAVLLVILTSPLLGLTENSSKIDLVPAYPKDNQIKFDYVDTLDWRSLAPHEYDSSTLQHLFQY